MRYGTNFKFSNQEISPCKCDAGGLNLIRDKNPPLDLLIATANFLLHQNSCCHGSSESALVFDSNLAATTAQQMVAIMLGISVTTAKFGVSQAGS